MTEILFAKAGEGASGVQANLDAHTANTNNPHTVTAVQAGAVPLHTTINAQVGSYTLILTDDSKYVRVNSAGAANLTVPTNATVAFAVGTTIGVHQAGAGQVTVVASGGVTVNTAQTLALRAQHATAALVKVGTDEWDLVGDLEAAP